MAKITYEDKEFLNKNESIQDINKVNDTDLNQIKEVVNENDDKVGDLSDLNTTDKSSLVNAINSMFPENVIVETGSNSNGTWRKYANGDMECWFTQKIETEISIAWGSMYNSGTVLLHNFPQTFISKPIVLIDFETSGGWLAFLGRPSSGGVATTKNPGGICLLRGTSCGSANFNISVYAKGKWK